MLPHDDLRDHASPAARALVLLQERHLREFVEVWRRARAADLALPDTDDPSYASLDALLKHVLTASRFYVVWTAELLDLDDPAIDRPAEDALDDASIDRYLDHLAAGWRSALVHARPEAMESETRGTPWGSTFDADGMLEHAVMHPIRHTLQLEELMKGA